MAHVFLANGQALRLRLFPKSKTSRKRPESRSLALFDPPAEDDSSDSESERLAARIVGLVLLNRVNVAILDRAGQLGLRDWWLVGEGVFQTVWNLKVGRSAERDIAAYELFYFSEDLTPEAENEVVAAARHLFSDLKAPVIVSNQARTHLWFPEKHGVAYPPLTTAAEGILRFPCSPQAIGLKRTGEEFLDVYAPFGLGDVWDMIVRPNRALPLAKLYAETAEAWCATWPQLQVYAWDNAKTKDQVRPRLRVVKSQA